MTAAVRRWNHPVPARAPSLDGDALRTVLEKVRQWQPLDIDDLPDDIAAVLDDVPPLPPEENVAGGGMTHARTLAPAAPPRRTGENTVRTEPTLVPFVVQREGEEAAPDNLRLSPIGGPGRYRLRYADEDPRDRDLRGVLWARCSFGPVDDFGKPTGRPQWRMMHPLRQRGTMQMLCCQVCAGPARTPLGFVFLAGPDAVDLEDPVILTNQPPVCARHARTAAELCPHLTRAPMVFLARSAPLYGVNGVGYGYRGRGVQVVERPDGPIPYGHPLLPTVLASQMVRRLSSFRLLGLDELFRELERAG